MRTVIKTEMRLWDNTQKCTGTVPVPNNFKKNWKNFAKKGLDHIWGIYYCISGKILKENKYKKKESYFFGVAKNLKNRE